MKIEEIIKTYEPLVRGTVELFFPFLECAIHDLKSGKIAAIYNNLSNRKVADPSPLKELRTPTEKFPAVFEPYYETNWNGHKIKCTTVTIRDADKKPIALICFNFDTFIFDDLQQSLKTFLEVKKDSDNPIEVFSKNWQENIDRLINNFLEKNKLLLNQLTREQKQELLQNLSQQGVFFYKKAPTYIAAKLHISRATVYNHLKILRAITTS